MDLIENVKIFLIDAKFSTYAINAFLTLMQSYEQEPLSAREISNLSNVPIGRIYEVLEELRLAGLIESLETTPKRFRMIPLNQALYNLINTTKQESKQKVNFLFDRAKEIESQMRQADKYLSREKHQVFVRTYFGSDEIFKHYVEIFTHAKKEILLCSFLDENTPKILSKGSFFFQPLKEATERAVTVRILWSMDFDNRPLSELDIKKNAKLFDKLLEILDKCFQISNKTPNFENRYIPKGFLSYFDLFDQSRVVLKLRNPLHPYQVFGGVSLLDPSLVVELRKKFNTMWQFETLGF